MDALYHEELYRGEEALEKLAKTRITVCGAGALGANLAESLVRVGAREITIIDRDRIEERNLSTQPYQRGDVGSFKAKILAGNLYRAMGVEARAESVELTARNAKKLLRGADLVVDAFDNSVARGLVKQAAANTSEATLHAGMAADYAEVIWSEIYRLPSDAHDDICDYPLARNLVTLTAAIAAEAILRWIATGNRESYTITLGDFVIRPYPPA